MIEEVKCGWYISYDRFNDGAERIGVREGSLMIERFPENVKLVCDDALVMTLFDDDQECYYRGFMSRECAYSDEEHAFLPRDWGEQYAGITEIRLNGETV